MGGIAASALATLPAVVDVGGVKVAIAESDVEDYPGLWLRGTGGNALTAAFPPYPLKENLEKDRDFKVTEAVAGGRHFVDQARQGGLGLVECQQHLRGGFQIRRQHRDVQILHRFRRQIWAGEIG